MIPSLRKHFNGLFSAEKYAQFLDVLNGKHPQAISFRVAETPIFIDKVFKDKILSACETIIDFIKAPEFITISDKGIPKELFVPGDNTHPHFIAFDFGICQNQQGSFEPQLIEMQGFPSLFAYQVWHDEALRREYEIPENVSAYLNGFNKESYLNLLREIIIGNCNKEEVILLEIKPHDQKTRIDFYCTTDYLGIEVVCITELIKEEKDLFYINKEGKKIKIRRIYNRVVFDELKQQDLGIREKGKLFFEELNIEWITHPNWFYRISKFTLPFISNPYVPETFFLNELDKLPSDLENYVLKPLFSFAGQGVVIDVTLNDITQIEDPENWILQRKVNYAPVIQTPEEPAKAEIRIFYFWKDGEARPVATYNLARLSKGKMIGVRYNKDKEWVGGSLAYFEK